MTIKLVIPSTYKQSRRMKSLTRAEEQIMEAIWKIEQGFLKDVVQALRNPRPHSNTVATLIRILIEKGYISYEQLGRNNLYKVKITREQYAKKSVSNLMSAYFGGSPINIVSHLINDHKISVPELEDLLKKIKSSRK